MTGTARAMTPSPGMPGPGTPGPGDRLYTAAGAQELDRRAIEEQGLDGYALMQRAGDAAFRLLREQWPGAARVLVVCGGGNNGGDGLVVARLARAAGLAVTVLMTRAPEQLRGSAALAWRDFAAAGGESAAVRVVAESDVDVAIDADVIVDALFGTGLDRPVEGVAASLIDHINAAPCPVLALDIPSGLAADTGAILGAAIRADATVSFIARKRGLYTGVAPALAGRVVLADLATPAAIHDGLEPWIEYGGAQAGGLAWQRLPRRSPTAHKGSAGRVVIIGGHGAMAGAAALAGEAALRAGAGLVLVATHPQSVDRVAARRPELMVQGVADPEKELPGLLADADAFVIGPGLGRDDWAQATLATALAHAPAAGVIDADGLNGLAAVTTPLPAAAVLTPHPGEAGRLLACSAAEVEADRFAALDRLVARHAAAVVLKGAGTLVGDPQNRCTLIALANPALATGGTGDVLAGLIGGLLAQGCSRAQAARLGAWVHARAGMVAADGHDRGMVASDLMRPIRDVLNEVAGG